MSLSKLIVTIGPSSWDKTILEGLIETGMSIARFNFSHADYIKTKEIMDLINSLNKPNGPVSLMLDMKGPEIRTGDVDEPHQYIEGEEFLITVSLDEVDQHKKILFCDYPYLVEDLAPGASIIIDSGNLIVDVIAQENDHALRVRARNDALIGSRRHVNLPGIALRLPAMTDKDKKDLSWGVENGVDIVAASFIRTADHIKEIRQFLDAVGGTTIPIIAKIENQEGMDNLDEIVQEADGIMIARGDLGVEVAIQELPICQREINAMCKKYGKPVVYATELLKNMVDYPFPTRAEVSDIYHAVAGGHDALMLSDESATGKYPIKSLQTLESIAAHSETETERAHPDFERPQDDSYRLDKKYSARAAHYLADQLDAAGIVVFTSSGYFAKITSAFGTNCPIYTFTFKETTYRTLSFYYGVTPFLLKNMEDVNQNEQAAISMLTEQGLVKQGDKLIISYDGVRGGEKVAQVKVVTV